MATITADRLGLREASPVVVDGGIRETDRGGGS